MAQIVQNLRAQPSIACDYDPGSIDTVTAAAPASTCSPLTSPRTVAPARVDTAVTV